MPLWRGNGQATCDLPVVLLMECHPHSYGLGLSAIRAAAATVGGFSLLTLLDLVAYEHPASEASTHTL
jgi:hypothetical protein